MQSLNLELSNESQKASTFKFAEMAYIRILRETFLNIRAPRVWNKLPDHIIIILPANKDIFCKVLKTDFFN